MTQGYPKLTPAARLGERGVDIVSRVVNETFGWLFRRTHQEQDFGVDGFAEVLTPDGSVTGQMLAMQIKCGSSFLQEENRWGYVYRGQVKHFNYLANYPLPVVLVICDPVSERCYWAVFRPEQTELTAASWKVTISKEGDLSRSKSAIEALLPPLTDTLSAMEPYWEFNRVIATSTYIHFILDRQEVSTQDTSRPRLFFDRLRATRELAFRCHGKVEFSFHGYDDDKRELFEIPEVRRYVPKLLADLPELFFFVRNEEPNHTLRLLALCLTKVKLPYGSPTRKGRRKIVFDTDKVGAFMLEMFPGLNAMTEWLGMSLDENIRITANIFRSITGEAYPPSV